MTLGQWLNQMIIDGEGAGEVRDHDAAVVEAFRQPGPGDAVETLATPRDEGPARIEAARHPADEVGRVAEALDHLTGRIEAAEDRSAQAIAGIDESVRGALSRIEGAQREHIAVAARFEGAVTELKSDQARAAERLRRLEAEASGPRSAEALRALEGALGKVASHLYDGEARTREAIAALEARVGGRELLGFGPPAADAAALVDQVVARLGQRLEAAETRTAAALRELGASFSALDGRVRTVESAGGGEGADVEQRLEQLTGGLTERMEAVRQEMAAKLSQTADGRFDRMERQLGEMTAHVQLAEQRSAQAIEHMGREVISIADGLGRRVQAAEARSASAVEQVGGEMARIAASVEQRFNRADSVQAQALEKLGAEIARITEKLAERIGAAERRNALAVDDVGDQVARVTERLNQRQERSSSELLERIRLSEERTARLLDEARETIDSRLGEAQRRLAQPAAPAAAPQAALQAAPPPLDGERFSFNSDPDPAGQSIDEAAAEPTLAKAAPARDAQPAIFDPPAFETTIFASAEPDHPPFADEDFEAADGFAPIAEVPSSQAFDGDYGRDGAGASQAAPSDRPLSTREVIEQARAAARMAAHNADAKGKKAGKGGSLFASFGAKAPSPGVRRRASSTLATVFLVSGTAAAMGMAAAGMMLLARQSGGEASERVADASRQPPPAAAPGLPRAAIALSPQVAAPAAPAPAVLASDAAQGLYDEGVRRIEAKDRGGLDPLRRAADQGHAAAQFYLAKLYEVGEGGVKRNLAEARRWTERAAQGGEPRAMHNLALYAFKGEGGPKDAAAAAGWFRKAADLGLVDSQFNLAQLYEGGWGVRQNAAEAYKWYLIAARAGDATSRGRAAALHGQLTVEAQRTAERSAAGFRAQAAAPGAPTALAAASDDIRIAQRALARLGYYQSPQDGVASPGLPMAVAAYQRDQALPTTGVLDADTLARLAAFAR